MRMGIATQALQMRNCQSRKAGFVTYFSPDLAADSLLDA